MRVPSGLFLATLILPFVGLSELGAQSPANQDPRWVPISESAVDITYLDTRTVVEEPDGIFVVWLKSEFLVVQETSSGRVDVAKMRMEYNCGARTHSPLFSTYYLGATVIGSGPAEKSPQPVIPGSVGETRLEYVYSHY